MNIPPLISRTPPPINDDVIEDEDDDEDYTHFHDEKLGDRSNQVISPLADETPDPSVTENKESSEPSVSPQLYDTCDKGISCKQDIGTCTINENVSSEAACFTESETVPPVVETNLFNPTSTIVSEVEYLSDKINTNNEFNKDNSEESQVPLDNCTKFDSPAVESWNSISLSFEVPDVSETSNDVNFSGQSVHSFENRVNEEICQDDELILPSPNLYCSEQKANNGNISESPECLEFPCPELSSDSGSDIKFLSPIAISDIDSVPEPNIFHKSYEYDAFQEYMEETAEVIRHELHDESVNKIDDTPRTPSFIDLQYNFPLEQLPIKDDVTLSDDEFTEFAEFSAFSSPQENIQGANPAFDIPGSSLAETSEAVTLLCLKDEVEKNVVWKQLSQVESTPALNYKWASSFSNCKLLSALKIDSRNILAGPWNKMRFRGLTLEEKGSAKTDSFDSSDFKKNSVPHPHFDWVGSGLTNPLENNVCTHPAAVKTAMQSYEAANFVKSLPDLSFIKQNFIVFPKFSL